SGMTVSGGSLTGKAYGGGILDSVSQLSLTDIVVTNNAASYAGGGVALTTSTGSLALMKCPGTGKKAIGGARLYLGESCKLTLDSSSVSNNVANTNGVGGGILFYRKCQFSITNCTIAGNSAGSGGAIFYSNTTTSPLLIQESTISGNVAADDCG